MTKPKLYVLVGVPGSGKSSWVAHQDWASQCAYVSTDMWVDFEAERVGKTYTEVFNDFMPDAVRLMTRDVIQARDSGRSIIWDQTSTTVASRAKKFAMLPDYYAIAVVFKTPPARELMKRLASRRGKTIPWEVVSGMIAGFQMPTVDEGFSEIWHID